MMPTILISNNMSAVQKEIEKKLQEIDVSLNHPNSLIFTTDDKLGIEQARKIKEHLSLKAYQGKSQAVVILSAENLTPEAQNSLLKILEEPPKDAIFIMGAQSEDAFLPTFLSRCQVRYLDKTGDKKPEEKYEAKIEKIINSSYEQRFMLIEKLEDKDKFLTALVIYFREKLLDQPKFSSFMEDLILAQKWAKQNVNIRAILEYTMLKMPLVK